MASKRDPGSVEDGGWWLLSVNPTEHVNYKGVQLPCDFTMVVRPPLTDDIVELTVAIDAEQGPIPVAIGPRRIPIQHMRSYRELDKQLKVLDVDKLLVRATVVAARMFAQDRLGDVYEAPEAWRRAREMEQMAEGVVQIRRRRSITREYLEQVAEIYRRGVASGAPTRAVEKELYTSRSNAGRLVLLARKEGLLGHADSTRPGESTVTESTERLPEMSPEDWRKS